MTPIPLPPNPVLARAGLLGAVLLLEWTDGHRGEVTLPALRRACPCATCGGERAAARRNPLRVVGPAPRAQVVSAQAVGRYALQFTWGDGHSGGIYAFDLLRSLCECATCATGSDRRE